MSELYTADDLPNGTKFGEQKPREASPEEGPRPVLKGVPLRVIIDEDDERRPSPPSPSNFSKLTSGVSSFFNSTHNQKNQKIVKKFVTEGKLNDSFNDDEPVKRNFSSDIGSINLKESVVNAKKLQKTQSEMTINYRHPLDTCNDVNITYNGVTKLKTLKPNPRPTKNQTVDLITLSNDILHVSEDYLDSKDGSKLLNPKVFNTVTEKF